MHTVIIIDEESGNVTEYNHINDLKIVATSHACGMLEREKGREIYINKQTHEIAINFTMENTDDLIAYNLTSKKKGAYGDIL